MTSAKQRQRRPSLSNQDFLDKAFTLFVENGFERTSIDSITSAAGIAKRTVYLRYGDKEALFKAALGRAIEKWIVPVERLRAVEVDSLGETLLAVGRLLVDNLLSADGLRLLQLTNSVAPRMPEIGAYTVQQGIKPTISYLADLLRRRLGDELRHFPNPEGAAMAFMNLVTSGPANLVALGVLLESDFIESYIDSSVRLFLNGMLPPQSTHEPEMLRQENTRLKVILAEAILLLDEAGRQALMAQK